MFCQQTLVKLILHEKTHKHVCIYSCHLSRPLIVPVRPSIACAAIATTITGVNLRLVRKVDIEPPFVMPPCEGSSAFFARTRTSTTCKLSEATRNTELHAPFRKGLYPERPQGQNFEKKRLPTLLLSEKIYPHICINHKKRYFSTCT